MTWLRTRDWPNALDVRISLLGLEPLTFSGLPDTGAGITVLPGQVIDAPERQTTKGVFRFHRVRLIGPDRKSHVIELQTIGTTSCRKWGDPHNADHEVFLIDLTIGGRTFANVDAIFLPLDRDDEEPRVVLGRTFLERAGGCCFDFRGGRMRLSMCLLPRLLHLTPFHR